MLQSIKGFIEANKKTGKQLHFSLIVFLVCLLFTFLIWDHYFNSQDPLDRQWVSTLILMMGTLFSISSGLFVWSLESGKNYLEKEVKRRTEKLVQKEKETVAAEARRDEAERRHREVEEAYKKLQEAQDQLVQSEKLASIGRVVAGIVHELNTPLITMAGYTKLLLSHVKDIAEEELESSLQIIDRQSERCHKIVRDLLTFARWDRPRPRSVDLCELIDTVLTNLPLEFQADRIEVTKKYPDSHPILKVDPDQLQRVFLNILINVWHVLKEISLPRQLGIEVIVTGEFVQVFFTDTGPGIAKENLDKIFEPFFTTKPAGKGTGLGLSLSYAIIQMHGGKINVQSESGKGTTFVVELPLKVGWTEPGHGSGKEKHENKKKVLVVDDEPCILQFVTQLLSSWGYEFVTAANGEEAIKIVSHEGKSIGLIILDINMPGLNGFQTARLFQKDNRFADIPLVFLTGRADEADALEAQLLHACAVLRKPFDYKELHHYVSSPLGS